MFRALSFCLGLALPLAGAGAALAQEAMPTAGGVNSNAAPRNTAPVPELGAPERFADGPGPRMGPCGPLETPDGKPDKSAHGEVHAGIGTHGYREIGGAICKPIGENGAIAIAVDKVDGDYGRYGRRYR